MNVLLIFTDQQQRFSLGCMGNPNVQTPTLDALARRGTLFRRCYSNDPICGPFRGTLMTGQYSSRCGVIDNAYPLRDDATTLADAFNAGGHQTCFIGKWHLGGNGNRPIAKSLQGGFQRFRGYQCYNGFRDQIVFSDGREYVKHYQGHRTEIATNLAIEHIREMSQEPQPWMMTLAYQAPHYPVQPAEKYAQMYAGQKIIRRPNSREVNPFTRTWSPPSPWPPNDDPDYRRYGNDLDEYIRLYYAMCTQVDANVARLLETLDELGVGDDTMVIYTSDHGDMHGSHGLTNKGYPQEESAGIPLIIHVPGSPGGRVSDALVSGIDLMPTLLDLTGLPACETVDGKSFAPLLRGESQDLTGPIFSERNKWCMVCQGNWKLAADRTDDHSLMPTLLTNLRDDPYELDNRVNAPDAATKQARLLKTLQEWNRTVWPPERATALGYY